MNKNNWINPIEKSDEHHDKHVKTLANFLKELDETDHPLEDFRNLPGKKTRKNKRTRKS